MDRALIFAASELRTSLIFVSVVVCLIGSTATIVFFSKLLKDAGGARIIWLGWTALVGASTLWTSLLFAISSFPPPSQTGFKLIESFAALLVCFAGLYVGFFLSLKKHIRLAPEIGGSVLGLSIALTSFLLFKSYKFASATGTPVAFDILPFVVGMMTGILTMNVLNRHQSRRYLAAAAVLMTATCLATFAAAPVPNAPAVPAWFPFGIGLLLPGEMLLVAGTMVTVVFGFAASGLLLEGYRKHASRRAYHHLTLQDPLTHLPNRRYIEQIARDLLKDLSERNKSCAVVLVSLDEFKMINDLHGYETGDAVLRKMAHLFRKHLGSEVILSRFYGDEFLLINPSNETDDDAIEFARTVRALARRPVQIGRYRLSVQTSIGLAVHPRDGKELNQLIQRANLAAKQAKAIGSNIIQPYVTGMEETNRWEATLAADLRNAALENELSLVFQKQNKAKSGELFGYEALVRWRHSEKGPIPPEDFIPIAERSGIILDIGNWVLEKACREAAKWQDPLSLSVNASPLQLSRTDFTGLVSTVLMKSGLPAERLEIELTESTPIEDHERVYQTITSLRKMGVRVAMDDFGTGYSSLNTLQAFPFDKIKVDRVFTRSLETNAHSRAILRSAILLGHSFGIPVIAEGVETERQLSLLQEVGCQEVQGFYFGKHLLPTQIKSKSTTIEKEAI